MIEGLERGQRRVSGGGANVFIALLPYREPYAVRQRLDEDGAHLIVADHPRLLKVHRADGFVHPVLLVPVPILLLRAVS